MAYTSIENSAEIQALKQQYAEAQAAGASKSVLNSIHQAAETLRAAAGYESTDGTGETFRETSASKAAAAAAKAAKAAGVNGQTVIGQYDPSQFAGGSGTISKYAGYIIIGVLVIAILGR